MFLTQALLIERALNHNLHIWTELWHLWYCYINSIIMLLQVLNREYKVSTILLPFLSTFASFVPYCMHFGALITPQAIQQMILSLMYSILPEHNAPLIHGCIMDCSHLPVSIVMEHYQSTLWTVIYFWYLVTLSCKSHNKFSPYMLTPFFYY